MSEADGDPVELIDLTHDVITIDDSIVDVEREHDNEPDCYVCSPPTPPNRSFKRRRVAHVSHQQAIPLGYYPPHDACRIADRFFDSHHQQPQAANSNNHNRQNTSNRHHHNHHQQNKEYNSNLSTPRPTRSALPPILQQAQTPPQNTLKCPICIEAFVNIKKQGNAKIVVTKCGHLFCEACLKKAISPPAGGTRKCPKCRKTLPKTNPTAYHEIFDIC